MTVFQREFPKDLGFKISTHMAKFPTFPTTYEDRKSFSISDLRKWGYLVPGQLKSGTINWNRNGNPTGSISIAVYMDLKKPYLTVDYILNKEKEVSYNIPWRIYPAI